MEAEQRKEWYALEQEATERLRRGHTPGRSGVSQMFQVLVLPEFGAGMSWEVCQDLKAAPPYFAVRSIWHKEADLEPLTQLHFFGSPLLFLGEGSGVGAGFVRRS